MRFGVLGITKARRILPSGAKNARRKCDNTKIGDYRSCGGTIVLSREHRLTFSGSESHFVFVFCFLFISKLPSAMRNSAGALLRPFARPDVNRVRS